MLLQLKNKVINKFNRSLLKSKSIQSFIKKNTNNELNLPKLNNKIKLGILFIILSFVIGWGMAVLMEMLAIYFKSIELAIIGPFCYFISWFIWLFGMLLLGKANYEYAKSYIAKYLKGKYGDGLPLN